MRLVYYVYYKVAAESEQQALLLARSLVAGIQDRTGIRGRLLRRRDDPSTWMEVYEGVPDGAEFEAALVDRASALDFQRILKDGSSRRLEIFQDL